MFDSSFHWDPEFKKSAFLNTGDLYVRKEKKSV
jgi:hypothetical protein